MCLTTLATVTLLVSSSSVLRLAEKLVRLNKRLLFVFGYEEDYAYYDECS
jgi:hypothetical protein